MKVFQINSVCGVRSTGRIVTDIYDELKRLGHECKIAYGRFDAAGAADDDVIRIGGKYGVYADAFLSRLTGRCGEFSSRATEKLTREIADFGPDIVHLHNLHGYYVNAFKLAEFLGGFGVPVVWTLHDCWPFTGHCAYFDRRACDKWKTGCNKCPAKRDYPKSTFFDASERQYAMKKKAFTLPKNLTVVTPSEWLKNSVKQSFLVKYPCVVINNGINSDIFRPTEKQKNRFAARIGKPYVLGVALPFSERKGFSDFIKMRGILGSEYEMVLVGVDAKQKKKLPEGIIGIERTDDAASLAEIYSGAECFFNLTYEDNFPTTNIESLMCGTPVITYDTGGSPASVKDGCGAVVAKGDVEAAVKKLNDVVAIKNNRDVSLAARLKFDRRVMAKKYFELYRSAIEAKNGEGNARL